MTRMRSPVLAGVVIAVTVAASSCGGPAAKPHASMPPSSAQTSTPSSPGVADGTSAEPPPDGYQWARSATQNVWFAVPDNWAVLNLAKISFASALSRLAFKGISSSYLRNALAVLRQRRAIYVADLASAARSPHQFATNGNAFCTATALVPSAASATVMIAGLRAEYAQLHAHILTIGATTIDGNPGVRAEYTITSTAGLTITEVQYTVLTNNSRLCFITLTTDRPAAYRQTFSTIGSTIRVS